MTDLMPAPTQALVAEAALSPEDAAIAGWLAAKESISHSAKTRRAYTQAIADFRAVLAERGLGLFAAPGDIYKAAVLVIGASKRGRIVAPATRRQRRAILSSFYSWCQKAGVYSANPILLTEMPRGDAEHVAPTFAAAEVGATVASIDTSSLAGQRDQLLLALALVTTRRAGELARLRWGDLRREGGQTVAHWVCKGGKRMRDALDPEMVSALTAYRARLARALTARRVALTEETPIFPSFSGRNFGGHMTTAALGEIAGRYLGDTRFHALRHTAVVTMEAEGVAPSAMMEQTGHGDLKVLTLYLRQHRAITPANGTLLARAFGLRLGPQKEGDPE